MDDIRIAIHDGPNAFKGRWEGRWIEYCQEQAIAYELVDSYGSDIINRLRDFDGYLWHFHFAKPTDQLMARHLLMAAEQMGLAVFPNTATCWHYDDKVAQKYLLEGVGAPLASTYVFYSKEEALDWLREARFPLVRKLRTGAGSYNVQLLKSFSEAKRFCDRAFGRGIPPVPGYFADTATKIKKTRDLSAFWGKLKRMPRRLRHVRLTGRQMAREKGYVLFQEFLPDNSHDIRVAVVGQRAWGFTRGVRDDDFRASGSGRIDYDPAKVPGECVKIAFRVNQALGAQSLACDFARDAAGEFRMLEVSYGYLGRAVHAAPGYWTPELEWCEGHYWPQEAVLVDLLQHIRDSKTARAS